jgi:uncharacterized protein (DUF952 family)
LRRIYKLLDAPSWEAAQAAGMFTGSAVDERDGFIHFSDAGQAQETARLHFKGQSDLVLLTVDADQLGEALKWEPSRGGALFPHLYAPLPVAAVIDARGLQLDADGAPWLGPLS